MEQAKCSPLYSYTANCNVTNFILIIVTIVTYFLLQINLILIS